MGAVTLGGAAVGEPDPVVAEGVAERFTSGLADHEQTELTELAARLRLAVGRLNRRIRIDGHEQTPPLQLSALVTVEQHGPLRLSELARREAVTAPTMSRVLAALDEQGLVIRTPDPNDARGVRIVLSELGARRLNEVRSTRTALVARRLERLTADQRGRLADALPALEALLVDDDESC
ncbi:MarR family transcriptional regulator [Pseudonocardia sp. S2-4]|uniref:MarR family transcriptional regulator n=2 Tax=Pseudonocardia humida TaxID=2800819 RepID=A0ABT1A687_9PSEU|nr:MarR family transcriptional regulator [Pseudonocardia humida]